MKYVAAQVDLIYLRCRAQCLTIDELNLIAQNGGKTALGPPRPINIPTKCLLFAQPAHTHDVFVCYYIQS